MVLCTGLVFPNDSNRIIFLFELGYLKNIFKVIDILVEVQFETQIKAHSHVNKSSTESKKKTMSPLKPFLINFYQIKYTE